MLPRYHPIPVVSYEYYSNAENWHGALTGLSNTLVVTYDVRCCYSQELPRRPFVHLRKAYQHSNRITGAEAALGQDSPLEPVYQLIGIYDAEFIQIKEKYKQGERIASDAAPKLQVTYQAEDIIVPFPQLKRGIWDHLSTLKCPEEERAQWLKQAIRHMHKHYKDRFKSGDCADAIVAQLPKDPYAHIRLGKSAAYISFYDCSAIDEARAAAENNGSTFRLTTIIEDNIDSFVQFRAYYQLLHSVINPFIPTDRSPKAIAAANDAIQEKFEVSLLEFEEFFREHDIYLTLPHLGTMEDVFYNAPESFSLYLRAFPGSHNRKVLNETLQHFIKTEQYGILNALILNTGKLIRPEFYNTLFLLRSTGVNLSALDPSFIALGTQPLAYQNSVFESVFKTAAITTARAHAHLNQLEYSSYYIKHSENSKKILQDWLAEALHITDVKLSSTYVRMMKNLNPIAEVSFWDEFQLALDTHNKLALEALVSHLLVWATPRRMERFWLKVSKNRPDARYVAYEVCSSELISFFHDNQKLHEYTIDRMEKAFTYALNHTFYPTLEMIEVMGMRFNHSLFEVSVEIKPRGKIIQLPFWAACAYYGPKDFVLMLDRYYPLKDKAKDVNLEHLLDDAILGLARSDQWAHLPFASSLAIRVLKERPECIFSNDADKNLAKLLHLIPEGQIDLSLLAQQATVAWAVGCLAYLFTSMNQQAVQFGSFDIPAAHGQLSALCQALHEPVRDIGEEPIHPVAVMSEMFFKTYHDLNAAGFREINLEQLQNFIRFLETNMPERLPALTRQGGFLTEALRMNDIHLCLSLIPYTPLEYRGPGYFSSYLETARPVHPPIVASFILSHHFIRPGNPVDAALVEKISKVVLSLDFRRLLSNALGNPLLITSALFIFCMADQKAVLRDLLSDDTTTPDHINYFVTAIENIPLPLKKEMLKRCAQALSELSALSAGPIQRAWSALRPTSPLPGHERFSIQFRELTRLVEQKTVLEDDVALWGNGTPVTLAYLQNRARKTIIFRPARAEVLVSERVKAILSQNAKS